MSARCAQPHRLIYVASPASPHVPKRNIIRPPLTCVIRSPSISTLAADFDSRYFGESCALNAGRVGKWRPFEMTARPGRSLGQEPYRTPV